MVKSAKSQSLTDDFILFKVTTAMLGIFQVVWLLPKDQVSYFQFLRRIEILHFGQSPLSLIRRDLILKTLKVAILTRMFRSVQAQETVSVNKKHAFIYLINFNLNTLVYIISVLLISFWV